MISQYAAKYPVRTVGMHVLPYHNFVGPFFTCTVCRIQTKIHVVIWYILTSCTVRTAHTYNQLRLQAAATCRHQIHK